MLDLAHQLLYRYQTYMSLTCMILASEIGALDSPIDSDNYVLGIQLHWALGFESTINCILSRIVRGVWSFPIDMMIGTLYALVVEYLARMGNNVLTRKLCHYAWRRRRLFEEHHNNLQDQIQLKPRQLNACMQGCVITSIVSSAAM